MSLIVELCFGVDSCVEKAVMAVIFAYAVPGGFDFQAVGDVAGFQSHEAIESYGRDDGIAGPLRGLPAVDGSWSDGNKDGDLIGKFFGGLSGEADFRRAEFCAQETELLVDGANLLGEKNIDGHSGIRFTDDLTQMLLDDFRTQ